jgi:hypothetical protein
MTDNATDTQNTPADAGALELPHVEHDEAPPLEPGDTYPVDEERAFAAMFIAQTADAVAEAVERGIKNALADGGADAIRQVVSGAVREALADAPSFEVCGESPAHEYGRDPEPETQQAQHDAPAPRRIRRLPDVLEPQPKKTRALYPHPRRI